MAAKSKQPEIPLPKSWDTHVKSGILHIMALAQYALTYSRSWAADSSNQRVRLKAECDRLQQELSLLREEMRIKDARMAQIAPKQRPHYPSTARLAILELRTSRGWSSFGKSRSGEELPPQAEKDAEVRQRVVTAKRINHVWHVDLTLVPTQLGFWTSWLPWSLPQRWPFGYCVAVVMDHFSRRAMGFAVFPKDPDSRAVRAFLAATRQTAQGHSKTPVESLFQTPLTDEFSKNRQRCASPAISGVAALGT